MTTVRPNAPMEVTSGAQSFTCYTAPGVTFHSEVEMKEHYRSEWHRHNLKRKVAGLGPISREAFEERAAREAAAPAADAGSRSQQRRQRREAKQQQKAAADALNPHSKRSHFEATRHLDEEGYIEHKVATAEPFDECSDLFSRHRSASLADNLAYMAKTHGFYLPYADYVTDLAGLVAYLQEKVYVGNMALLSGKAHHSLEAVQAHMRDKRACRFELEGNEEEYEAFYDLEALAERSPLWEIVEEEEGDDDEGWEDMDDDDEAAAMEEDEDELTRLFSRAISLGLLSEARVDALTDAVAEGQLSEESLLKEWGDKVRAAAEARGGEGGEAGPSDAAASEPGSSGSTRLRVRYRVLTGLSDETTGTDVGALALPSASPKSAARELGHRSMRYVYRQRFRPSSDALGASNPALHRLMLTYAKAGVLSQPLGARAMPHGGLNERSRAVMRTQDKRFLAQGMNNNQTMSGQKHYKNQSLNF